MNHRIIISSALSLLFSISYLHACAGYTFHFDLPKVVSIPLDSYISRMLPDDKRASKEYLDEIDKLKTVMDIKTPVLVMKASFDKNSEGKNISAHTENVGFSHLRYSIVRLSEDAFARHTAYGFPWANTQLLAHELGHVKKNHSGVVNALYTLRRASIVKSLCGKYLDEKIESLDSRLNGTYVETKRRTEYEAETEGIAALARCGYANAIEANLEFRKAGVRDKILTILNADVLEDRYCNGSTKELLDYCQDIEALMHKPREEIAADIEKLLTPAQTQHSIFSPQYWVIEDRAHREYMKKAWADCLARTIEMALIERPHGYIYPTVKEMLAYQSKGLAECLENTSVDPRTTQDTPNLMRNGSRQD